MFFFFQIAAAIMEHPDIILIDEPTNALDSKGVEMVKCMPYKIAVTKYPSRKYIQFG